MVDYLLLNKDVTEDVRRHYSPEVVKLERIWVKVHVPDDRGLVAAAMKDTLLQQRMTNTVQNLVTGDLAKLMAYQVGVADTKAKAAQVAGNQAQVTMAVQSVERLLNETRSQIIPKIEAAAGQVWRDLTKTKKDYQNYQIKCGIKIAATMVSSGLAIAGAIGTGGAALAVALFGLAKNASDLYTSFTNLASQAEEVQKDVQKALATVGERYKDISRGRAALTELMRAGVSSIATPERCKELNELYGNKLKGLEVTAHQTSETLTAMLGKTEALGKTIDPPRAGKMDSTELLKLQKRKTQLTSLEKQVNQMIERITSLMGRLDTGKTEHGVYAKSIDELQKKVPTWAAPASKFINFAVGAGLSDATEAGDILQNAAFALVDTYGDDIVDKAVELYGRPSGTKAIPGISAPKLVGTTANLASLKLKPIVPPPKR
jgi:hypothetical protein